MKKNPIVAAILNFLFFGAGYWYNGKTKKFGIALIVAWVVLRTSDIMFFLNGTVMSVWYILIGGLAVLQITFAIDGFRQAQEISFRN